MSTEVLLIQLAPKLHVPGTLARHDAGTPQAVKRLRARGMLPTNDAAHNLTQRGVLIQGDKNSPQVVPVRAVVPARARRELEERETALCHLVQSALRQKWLSAEQSVKALKFALVTERESVAPVQFTHLV